MTDRVQAYYLYQQDSPPVPANVVASVLYLNRVTSPLPNSVTYAKATTYRHRVAASGESTHAGLVTYRCGQERTAFGESTHAFYVVPPSARKQRVFLRRQNMVATQAPRTMIPPVREYWIVAPTENRTAVLSSERRYMEA